jgi:Skp family chaperone for outer membrane proteins
MKGICKMNKNVMAIALLAACSLNAKDIKVCYIDPSNIIMGSEKWKDLGESARAKMEEKARELTKMQQTLQKEMKDYESMGNAASKDARAKKEEQIAKLRSEIEIKYQSLQAYEQRLSQEAQMEVLKDIELATAEVAAEKDIDMITAGAVIFAKKDLNVTDEVLARVNKNYTVAKSKTTDAAAKLAKSDTKKDTPKVASADKADKKSEKA